LKAIVVAVVKATRACIMIEFEGEPVESVFMLLRPPPAQQQHGKRGQEESGDIHQKTLNLLCVLTRIPLNFFCLHVSPISDSFLHGMRAFTHLGAAEVHTMYTRDEMHVAGLQAQCVNVNANFNTAHARSCSRGEQPRAVIHAAVEPVGTGYTIASIKMRKGLEK
jgi:hypothetical protein